MSSVTVKDIFDFLNNWAPLDIAEPQDNNGLQIGSFNSKVKKILLSVNPSLEAIKQAINESAELIITHHPLFFSPIKNIIKETLIGEKIYLLTSAKINLISWHTPLDKVIDGVSEAFLNTLGFQGTSFILSEDSQKFGLGKIVHLENPIKIQNLANLIKTKISTWVMVVGDLNKEIRSFAFCGGSCGFLKEEVKKLGIDTFITCDIKYHLALDALEEGFNFIILEHGISESFVLEILKEKLCSNFPLEVSIFKEKNIYKII